MTIFTETIVQLAVLVAASAAHHISSTPPQIAQQSSNHLLREEHDQKNKAQAVPGPTETLHGHRRFNRLGLAAVASTKYAVWFITILEVASRLLSLYPHSAASTALLPILLPARSSSPSLLTHASPVFTLSVLSIFIGFTIRRACFAIMGRLFSFTHTTLATHKLVTGGPYNIVRHPSYTGEVLVRGGMVALLLRPDGLAAQSGALALTLAQPHAPAAALLLGAMRVALAFYVGWVSFGCTYLILRAPREDATLHEKFGEQWEAYSARVPWRFVPYVA
ncbi:hypothetical protein M0805_007112 [Coniferiporia weirii]|nr:hypothetical protein M0805_007112 [Coniferiporia weirii]